MKALYIFVLSVLTFTACNRQNDAAVQPDRARRMAGTYQISLLTMQAGSQPSVSVPMPLQYNGQPLLSGAITITRKSENRVDATVAMTVNKSAIPANVDPALVQDQSYTSENLEIRDNGTGYDLFVDGDKIARFDDNTFTIQRVVANPQTGETYNVGLQAKK
ncbi:hypothetical protein [Spirosoma montaniterrae]|uniref:Lipocalin-like domain-containing protein n=1 Tax=Spirosoma montaniterrae TaxID=1178516 RepID=A0A1P9WS17_9BACT|nr:hypothetical protein [Spirosoma montaniterrae]AQG78167.1 hypothetical protein AWR27_01670 [Spirosoma montaniterrae]